MRAMFRTISDRASHALGTPWAFITAVVVILVWAITGPVFHFTDTWQLVINTGTTIITFLMVFLIQNTQNRDAKAIHLKLDELIRAVREARNELVDIEDCTDEELQQFQEEFKQLQTKARNLNIELTSARTATRTVKDAAEKNSERRAGELKIHHRAHEEHRTIS